MLNEVIRVGPQFDRIGEPLSRGRERFLFLSLHQHALRKGHMSTQREDSCLQTSKRALTQTQPCQLPDLRLPAFRTTKKNKFLLVKTPSL